MLKIEVWNVWVVNRIKSVKPLTNIEEFLKRFDNFRDGEFRSVEIISPTDISLTFAIQDSARAFDWISITLEFNGVCDARLQDNNKLSLIDMSEGITILKENNKLAFGIGECYNINSIKNSSLFIESTNIKYKEGLF